MKLRFTSFAALILLGFLFSVLPAAAGEIYNNGPINGQTDAWTINLGFAMSDSFVVSSPTGTLTGLSFGAWLFPGDTVTSVEVMVTQYEFDGRTYFDGIVNLTASNCFTNNYSFEVCQETGSFSGPTLPASTYWVTLQNAVTNNGDPVYWDENSGPSSASATATGTLPSEAFTIFGNSGSGTTPEPGTLLLFASGALGVAGITRRKLL